MRHRTSIAVLAFGLLLPLGAAACGDDDDGGAVTADTDADATTTSAAAPDDQTGGTLPGSEDGAVITIASFSFTNITVAAGAEVGVSNEDGTTHTVTSDDDAWESVRVDGGASDAFTAPAEAGTYAFHCEIHATMTGTLTVE